MKISMVAVNHGPWQALEPLTASGAFSFSDIEIGNGMELDWWVRKLSSDQCDALVVGTSDGKEAFEIEALARIAANVCGLPFVVIEDYPGNYRHVDGGAATLLVVDSEFGRRLHQNRLRGRCPPIWVCKAARYDALRKASADNRWQLSSGWHPDTERGAVVLWAGQPETEDGLATLERILPVLTEMHVHLLFKAHPRDAGYRAGAYQGIFKACGLGYTDVTDHILAGCMALGPRLVLTQFSSMAVEAGFYGVPSVHLLYQDIGGKRLHGKKGFDLPPWCEAGAAFVITETDHHKQILHRALWDEKSRVGVMDSFDVYFGIEELTTPSLIRKIFSIVG